MTEAPDLRSVGARVESLLAELQSVADPTIRVKADEIVRLLVELYGAGLERIVEVVAGSPVGCELLEKLTADDLVASLLVLHDLHPQTTEERVWQALEQVRPYLGSHAGGVEFLGIDDAGVAHLKLQGSCDGCASSTVTVKLAIERAINEAAPELGGIEVEGVTEPKGPKLLQIETIASPASGTAPASTWVPLPGLGPLLPGECRAVDVGSVAVLVCSSGGSLYAYRNACGACGSALEHGTLAGAALTCPACAARFDVRRAGRSLDGLEAHLDPLPLLTDGGEPRVAVSAAVPA